MQQDEKQKKTLRETGVNKRIKKMFHEILVNSLNTQQVDYLGERYDHKFSLNKVSGFTGSTPIPRQTAADTLLLRFSEEYDIVNLFSILLAYEGKRFYNRDLVIWGRDDFIRLLTRNKWIFDRELKQFFLDPFYEHEINFLNRVKLIDLRQDLDVEELTHDIKQISSSMSIRDLEWRITVRLYDMERKSAELLRKIIDMLLSRQNLQIFAGEIFFCFKELAINASKANYKILFHKYVTSKDNIGPDKDYQKFLELFKEEIEMNGNSNLFELAKKDDRFYTITFQSSLENLEIWVTNTQNITLIEKEQILKKLDPARVSQDSFQMDDDENTEGAGLGLNLIITVLKKYSSDKNPLKVVFYPEFIKIGFELKRSELMTHLPREEKPEENKQPEAIVQEQQPEPEKQKKAKKKT